MLIISFFSCLLKREEFQYIPNQTYYQYINEKVNQLGKSIKFFTTEKITHRAAKDPQDLNSVFQKVHTGRYSNFAAHAGTITPCVNPKITVLVPAIA